MLPLLKQWLLRTWRPTSKQTLLAGWALFLMYAYPGYMNFDVGEQLFQIREGKTTDWHPPIMGGYWRILEVFITGPFPMLLLQSSLYLWGIYTLLRKRFAPERAAWISVALLLFPPLMTPMGMIWKDAQMTAFLIAGTALVLKPSWAARVTGVVLFILAAGVRHNGIGAVPFLAIAAVNAWLHRKWFISVAVAAVLTVAILVTSSTINSALTDVKAYSWYRTTAVFDLVGTICFAPKLTDEQVQELLVGIDLGYKTDMQQRFCRVYPAGKGVDEAPPWFDYVDGWNWWPGDADRAARRAAWKNIILKYPGAYLKHRMTITSDLLGLGDARLWEPVGQDFAANEEHLHRVHHDHTHSWFQTNVGDACRWLAYNTPLYRVYIYALCCLLFFLWAIRKRDWIVVMLCGSGLAYELSLAIGTNAPDFRYSHWMLVTTFVGGILLLTKRWQVGDREVT